MVGFLLNEAPGSGGDQTAEGSNCTTNRSEKKRQKGAMEESRERMVMMQEKREDAG
jgi:hypothetical protein